MRMRSVLFPIAKVKRLLKVKTKVYFHATFFLNTKNVNVHFLVLNLGSEKGTHFLGQKGHFLSRNLILRAHYFAVPRHYAAH